jgi:ATP-dependent DNA helicase RecG
MALPINVKDLIERKVVENTRVEYKGGWNPEPIIQSICAFANDIENVGGGYIIVGLESEDGIPKFPSERIKRTDIDKINQDLLNKCNLIEPRYFPVTEAAEYMGMDILVIWAYGGENRIYRCPAGFPNDKNKKEKVQKVCFIRRLGSTIKARPEDEKDLLGMSGIIPFDDRLCRRATLNDISPALITNFLYRIGSELHEQAGKMTLSDLAESMHLLGGSPEQTFPRNVALMFFNNTPEKFFQYPQIEVVDKPDPTGEGMVEKIFRGPLDRQLEDALTFIKNYIIKEKIRKFPDRPEAERVFNYPARAIEEALANAVYHRSYEVPEPITVTVTPEGLEILSHPGPDRSISDENLKNRRLIARSYRNRRIGDYLKELNMIEGRNTGIPTILRSIENNGSPLPRFETDEDRTFFSVFFPVHKEFAPKPTGSTKPTVHTAGRRTYEQLKQAILDTVEEGEITTTNLLSVLGYASINKKVKQAIAELLKLGKIAYTIPDKPNSRNQKLKKA